MSGYPLRMFIAVSLVVAALLAAPSAFAGCRAGDAAARGSKAGFDRMQENALNIATNEGDTQSALQTCLSGITATVTAPQFPSLSDVFGRLVKQVCYAASQKVNSTLNPVLSQLNLNPMIDQAVSNINSASSSATGGLVNDPVSRTPMTSPGSGTSILPSSGPSVTPPDFWNKIWK